MKFGYLSSIGEITPSIFSGLNKAQRAKVFLVLYNTCVQNELKIPLKYAKFINLKTIFNNRIKDLLRPKNINFKRASSFCLVSNVIINAYENGDFSALKDIAKEPKYPVAKLIKMLFISGDFEICFNANDMFSQFVYEKISQKHPDKKLFFKDNIISIKQENRRLFGILPSFKEISLDDLRNINNEINLAVSALNLSDYERVYIVFPRNNKFRRHVEVRHCECANGGIKLVPYTISNKIF